MWLYNRHRITYTSKNEYPAFLSKLNCNVGVSLPFDHFFNEYSVIKICGFCETVLLDCCLTSIHKVFFFFLCFTYRLTWKQLHLILIKYVFVTRFFYSCFIGKLMMKFRFWINFLFDRESRNVTKRNGFSAFWKTANIVQNSRFVLCLVDTEFRLA